MSRAVNYDDVLAQFRAEGMIVEYIEVGLLRRCKVEGEREKCGWYYTHEIDLPNRDTGFMECVMVGSFGIFRGATTTRHRIDLKKRDIPSEQKSAISARIAEDRRRAEAARVAIAARAARRASNAWRHYAPTWTPSGGVPMGSNPYLLRKSVEAYGVRFTPTGKLVIPITDVDGQIHGLQFVLHDPADIAKKGRDKDYWPKGLEKVGHFHLIGGAPSWIVLVAEGYATAASLHEATGLPVAVAFDANNLQPVAKVLHKRYRGAKILICADDDFATWKNPGVSCASAAAFAAGGEWLAPHFTDDLLRAAVTAAVAVDPPATQDEWKARVTPLITGRQKLTDFNDKHVAEGLHLVRTQIEAKLQQLGWAAPTRGAPTPPSGEGGKRSPLRSITTTDELHDRFSLVYGHKQTVFDSQERILLSVPDMRDACTHREIHRRWMESSDKRIVRINEVGFDPGGADPTITCNLWGGWPTKPKAGRCEVLLDLLAYLCNNEKDQRGIYDWTLKWLAYPIQNPGAKMRSALVLHGPQGVGKNMFFEAIMAIYGEYGRIVDQSAVEDKFNDWASKKLYLICDEVVARQELFHTKNKLKALITSDWIRINPKNVAAHDERNHVNLVFLSNETQPLVLERDDRRYAVIWTPPKLDQQLYLDVKDEIDHGGIEALHDYLLNLDLSGFGTHTPPPMTGAKAELIDLSMDSTERFWRAWIGREIEGVPVLPCKSQDLYAFYRDWCARAGYARYASEPKLLAEIGKRSDARKQVQRYQGATGTKQATFIFPPGADPPPAKSQAIWLAECLMAFQDGVRAWKEDKAA